MVDATMSEKTSAVGPNDTSPLLSKDAGTSLQAPVYSDEFSSLPPSEAEILREQVQHTEKSASFLSLFRYADSFDKLLLVFGVLTAIAEGCMRPLMTIVFGQVTDLFSNYTRYIPYEEFYSPGFNYTESYYNSTDGYNTTYYNQTMFNTTESYYNVNESIDPNYFQSEVNRLTVYFVIIGIADVALSYFATYLFIDRGEVLSARIREKYLEATLRQNIGYFDKVGTGEITSRISADAILIQEGISEKVGYCVANFATLIAGFIVGMVRSYKLALILSSMLVMMMISFAVGSQNMKRSIRRSLSGYSVGGTLAEEVLASVRNVQAFGIQERLALRYDSHLVVTEKYGLRAGICLGIMSGIMWFGIFGADAIAFFTAPMYIERGELTTGIVVTVLLTITHGAFAMSHIAPHFKAFTSATAAASKIYSTIDRVSAIDSMDASGDKIENIDGEIELKEIKFIYPSRPNVVVLDDFSLKIPAGKTVALVGASGSGKSTIVGLIERFYKPVKGQVTLDGHDITSLNLRWMRSTISLVSQEPTLFSTTVYENVEQGLIGSQYENLSAVEKRELVIEACKQANALSFIEALPEGFNTNVGERGFLLSGGQKQRIAIARAIVSNPRILLLDEATSALDTKSEGIVQEALDRASKNRTTIVIAHRLSTIKDADVIVVMKRGEIIETGTHNELIAKKGEYYDLVQSQKIEKEKKAAVSGDEPSSSSSETSSTLDEKLDEEELLEKVKTKASVKVRDLGSDAAYKDVEIQASEVVDESGYTIRELVKFIARLSQSENAYVYMGIMCSVIQGLSYPALGEFYGHAIQGLQFAFSDPGRMYSETYTYAGLFIFLAVLLFATTTAAISLYTYVAQRLIRRIRYQMFRNYLRQDISFFDRDENTTGTLTMSLAREAQSIDGLSGATFGQIMNSIVNVISSAVLAIIVAWNLGLVCVACVPLMVLSGFFRFWVLSKFEETVKKSHESSASYACEAASAIKTVISLTREDDVCEHYHEALHEQTLNSRVASRKSAILYAIAQGMQYFITALAFWYGGNLLRIRQYGLLEFYIAYMAVIFGAQGAGIVFSFASDMGKARLAAANVKKLFDRVPEIDAWSTEGSEPENVEGNIEFKDVVFRYPTRPQVPVLNGLNLSIKKGQYVALVGASGCGKSTTIGLIESFYRPNGGQVLLDGVDIRSFNVNDYRSHIALVSQEPTLYAGTIRDNVKLGSPYENISDEEMMDVCKQANIHDFIMSLPDGYETLVGSKGTLLSGGQKQRVAIARALIRQPKILLLDEATSALDSESEKIVQAALDEAAKGRTTIAVAHRLSTIQNADVIFVFDQGAVVERGSHQELLAKRGKYYELVQMQALEEMQ
ncbi:P-loop containing nucleoside triphosphate hydrolase protein [Lipomyces tetrasporus]|uniref:P-loop containing nucleoside triphosphate hydrolase protein n=1 Tax=Lipomyces tetrasporus TaxID=54092 RepID=A0AAD7QXK5_9ASCO|nr:P-loop containing nucleoside triphosphate hydrolase protein [Lipomyces tetrasporus]KAJ8103332.1 P-loop containing nucleoside triphosphate hydrolase protein [Lipomyces tetrasporus]